MQDIAEALIFAGGPGERLRPLTLNIPKALVVVRGIPILGHQVMWLKRHGVRRVVIACGYLSQEIDRYTKLNDLGVEIELSTETRKLGTAGALKLALGKLRGDEFIALNGDIISNMNLSELVNYHHKMRKLATIVVVPFRSPYGIVTASNGILDEFKEKPSLPYWTNAGIYVLDRRIESRLPDEGGLENDVFSRMGGEIAVFMSREAWVPIDTTKDLREAEALLSKEEGDL